MQASLGFRTPPLGAQVRAGARAGAARGVRGDATPPSVVVASKFRRIASSPGSGTRIARIPRPK